MRSNLPIFASFRIVLAIVFGFMSLEHGPVMTFAHAHAALAQDQIVASDHSHGHHEIGAGAHDQWAPITSSSPTICYSAGCFVTVEPPVIGAPVTSLIPLGKIIPARTRVMVSTLVEPPDPPPRPPV